MTIDVTAGDIREAGRHASESAARRGQRLDGDAAREVADAIGARGERSNEIVLAPVGGPEYTGRA